MASRGINKVILIGNLGADPEIRYFPSGDAVANFNIATSESWKDKTTGEPQERTEWHRIVIFGKLAEIAKQYLHKGSKVYIEGKLRTRKWQGQDGQDRYTTEVIVDLSGSMQMLDSRPADASSGNDWQASSPPARAAQTVAPQVSDTHNTTSTPQTTTNRPVESTPAPAAPEQPFDDDIPF